jgi:hypothetical protein
MSIPFPLVYFSLNHSLFLPTLAPVASNENNSLNRKSQWVKQRIWNLLFLKKNTHTNAHIHMNIN